MQYQPKLLVDEHHIAPKEQERHEDLAPTLEEMAVDELLDNMRMVELVLQ